MYQARITKNRRIFSKMNPDYTEEDYRTYQSIKRSKTICINTYVRRNEHNKDISSRLLKALDDLNMEELKQFSPNEEFSKIKDV